jgi:esterase/lipase superfamily enzyme
LSLQTAPSATLPAPRGLARALLGLALAFMLAGCATLPTGGLTSFVSTGESTPPRIVPIYMASIDQGEGRAALAAPRFSRLDISIPPGHRPGEISRPTLTPESPRRHMVILARQPMDEGAFRSEIESRAQPGSAHGRDVLVYVHGFNAGGAESQYRLAQIVADSGFTGSAVLFAWPTRNSVLSYGADREAAAVARDQLEDLLRSLAARQGGGRLHILAHSMGAWLTMETLRQNAIGGSANFNGRLGEVMLAAPDVDLDVFRSQMSRLGSSVRVSLFVASDDRALQLSARLAGDRVRVGALDLTRKDNQDAVRKLGVRVYDLTAAEGASTLRHGTFAEAPQVVAVIGGHIAEPKVVDRTAFGGEGDADPKLTQPDVPQAAAVSPPSP